MTSFDHWRHFLRTSNKKLQAHWVGVKGWHCNTQKLQPKTFLGTIPCRVRVKVDRDGVGVPLYYLRSAHLFLAVLLPPTTVFDPEPAELIYPSSISFAVVTLACPPLVSGLSFEPVHVSCLLIAHLWGSSSPSLHFIQQPLVLSEVAEMDDADQEVTLRSAPVSFALVCKGAPSQFACSSAFQFHVHSQLDFVQRSKTLHLIFYRSNVNNREFLT